jgi:hypothetical protein
VKDTTTGLNNQFAVSDIVVADSPSEEFSIAALQNVDVQAPETGPQGDQIVEKGIITSGNLSEESVKWLNSSCDLPGGVSFDVIKVKLDDRSDPITCINSLTLRIEKTEDYDPDIDHFDEILDLQYFTKSYSDGFSYACNLAEMLKKGGWWGLVGVELNPGPKGKKVASKKQAKVREVVKFVEKDKGTRKSSKGEKSTGRSIGSKIGGFLGDAAQKAVMAITGMGDYQVKSNTLYNGSISSSSPPRFTGASTPGATRLQHREYLGDVLSSGSPFNLQTYIINPESPATFPWLSAIALNFEQYRFHGLVFEFKTTSATAVASTNTALGSVILATQYNALEEKFVSKLQMDQYEYAVSTNPSISCIHPIECDPRLGAPLYLYTNSSSVQGNAGDPRLTVMGNFSIATVGQQSAATIGELWISYDVEFIKPRLDQGVVSYAQDYFIYMSGPTNDFWTLSTTNMFENTVASNWNPGNTSELPVIFGKQSNGRANQIYFPPIVTGKFNISFDLTMTGTGNLKTQVWQPLFRVANSPAEPWCVPANNLISSNSPTPPSFPAYFRSLQPREVGGNCNGAHEEYCFSIGNNTTGTTLQVFPSFPFDATLKFQFLAVRISPYWYSSTP